MKRCSAFILLALLLHVLNVQAATIVFTSSSQIAGSGVQLYFTGYGSTYERVKTNYTVSVESDNPSIKSIQVQDCAGPYLYCTMPAAPSGTQKTTVTLTYSNGDCGKVVFSGTTFSSTSGCASYPPEWDGDPSFTCGSANAFGLSVASHDVDGLVAGYKVKIGTCNVDVKLSKAVKNHSGVIQVPLTSCGITLTESSNYTAEIQPYDDGGLVCTTKKSVAGIKKSLSTISISSVSCGTVTATSVELIPVTSGGEPSSYKVTYGGTTKSFEGSSSFTIDNLEPDTKYTFTVRAVDGCGNVSSTSATAQCTTPYAPHGGADSETELVETEFKVTSTGNCSTSIAGGTSFSKYGTTGNYSHKMEDVDVIGEITVNNQFEEAYSNGYFHESGVSDTKYQYAITSNPKVLNGNYTRKTDKKNRIILAVGKDPAGQTVNLIQLKRTNLAAGSYSISFTVEDLVSSSLCPQTNLNSFRQLNVVVYKNGTQVANDFPQFNIGSTYNYTSSGTVSEGDVITVDVRARFLATCTALAISDIKIDACLNKAIETTSGGNVFCEDSEVTLMATGTSATAFTWEQSSDNVNWTTITGESGSKIVVTAKLGNTYYRYTENGGSKSKVFSLLGQVCCTFLEDQKAIWKETFGNGTGRWENANVKNHKFATSPNTIDDRYYAVVSNSSDANQNLDWPGGKKDHTGDKDGGFLVINVNNLMTPPVLIYSQTITPADGFCLSTYYNLSMFASNIAPAGLPSSFKFEIKDAATGNILGQGATGDINDFGMAHWLNYGSSFAPQNSESVIINIYNTGAAGGGNDVVIDDISVTVCSAKIELYADYPNRDVTNACGGSVTLRNIIDGNLYTYFGTEKPYFLWTKSTNGGASWSIVEEASGNGNETYTTVSKEGETAIYKVIVSAQESDARRIFSGETLLGCLVYAKTEEAKVECKGCDEVETPETVDGNACVNASGVEYNATASAGCTLVWYETLESTTPLASKPAVDVTKAGESFAYVSQKDAEGCESDRVKVSVMVNQTVLAVTKQPTEVCTPSKVDLTTAETFPASGVFKYFKSDKTTEETTPQSVDAGKYYIQLTENGCPSDPQELNAIVKNCDNLTLVASVGSTVCEGDEVKVAFTLKNKVGIPAKGVVITINETDLPGDVSVKKVDCTASTSYTSGAWNVGDAVDAVETPVEITFTIDAGESFSLEAFVSAVNGKSYTRVEAIAMTDKSYYAKSETSVRQYASAPIVENYENCATTSALSFDLSERVTSGKDHLTWYTGATGTEEVESTTVYKNQVQDNTYYVTNYTSTTCESSRTPLKIKVKKNAEFVTVPVTTCSADLKKYSIDVEVSEGNVTTNYSGASITHTGNLWSVSNIAKGDEVEITVKEDGCGSLLTVISPECACPEMPAPQPEYSQYSYCDGDPIPAMKASYGGDATNVVLRWYDTKEGGVSLYEGNEYTATSAGTYYVEAYNTLTECKSDRAAVVLKMNDIPAASIEKSNLQLTCDTTTITLKALPESGMSYKWSDASTAQTLEASVAGTYSVTVTDNTTQCFADASVTISEDRTTPVVDVSSEGGKTELDCATSSIKLTANVTQYPDVSYKWSSGETSQVIDATDAGTYSVEVKHKSSGCTASASIGITKDPSLPVVTVKASKMQFTCDTLQMELSAELQNITGTAHYKWFDGSTGATVNITAAGTYILEVTDDLPCTASGSITIGEDKSVPEIDINSDIDVVTCTSGPAKLVATDGLSSYVWKYSNGMVCPKEPGDADNELTTSIADIYTVFAKSKSSGCESQESKKIDENIDKPSLSLSTEEGVTVLTCDQTQLTLRATASNCTYSWKKDGGAEISTENTVIIYEAGDYSVTIVDNTTGCENSESITITANTVKPSVSITADPSTVLTCATKSVQLTANATDCTFNWNGISSAAQQVSVSEAGTYVVTVKSNSNGCRESASIDITENKTYPSVEVQESMQACSPETVDLKDALISQDCETVKYYTDASLQQEMTDTKVTALGDKTYYVQGSNSDGCVSEAAPITVSISELAVSIIPDVPVCQGSSVVIWGKGTGVQASKYTMQFTYNETPVGDKVTGDSIGVKVTPSTTSEYILTASNGACVKKLSTKVKVLPLPKTDYERTGTLSFDVKQMSTGAEPYRYSLDGGAPQDSVNFHIASFGNYKVKTTDVFGCSSEMDVFLEKIVMPITIPPYFTPNGDGKNDIWHITNIEFYPDATIYIYDRFDKLLVKLKGSDAGWDGTYNGHPMPMTDYWYLLYDEALGTMSGHFILKR